jgi:hypothetical protein
MRGCGRVGATLCQTCCQESNFDYLAMLVRVCVLLGRFLGIAGTSDILFIRFRHRKIQHTWKLAVFPCHVGSSAKGHESDASVHYVAVAGHVRRRLT